MSIQRPYDTSPDFGTLVDKHRRLPFKRFLDLVEAKVDDLIELLDRPVPYDQGPGRVVERCLSAWFGPISPTTAGRASGTATLANQDGHMTLATLADPATFIVPTDGDLWIGRDSSFRCTRLAAFGFVNWGYTADPVGFNVPYTNPNGVGDILSAVGPNPATGPNGGAMPLDFFGGTFATASSSQPDLPNIAFDVELFDKQRGRRLHERKIPSAVFAGGRFANRKTSSPLVFPRGTRVEPRLYVNEVRMGSVLDGATAFNAASVKAWVCLVFKGVEHLEVP